MPLSDLYGHRFRWPEIELFRQFLLWSIKSFKNSHWWDPGMQPAHYKDYIVRVISPLVLYVLGSTHIICHEPQRNSCKQESKKIYPCTLKHDLKPCYLTAKALVSIGSMLCSFHKRELLHVSISCGKKRELQVWLACMQGGQSSQGQSVEMICCAWIVFGCTNQDINYTYR